MFWYVSLSGALNRKYDEQDRTMMGTMSSDILKRSKNLANGSKYSYVKVKKRKKGLYKSGPQGHNSSDEEENEEEGGTETEAGPKNGGQKKPKTSSGLVNNGESSSDSSPG